MGIHVPCSEIPSFFFFFLSGLKLSKVKAFFFFYMINVYFIVVF